MQLSQREAERQERRATNLIWNAARDYSLAPVVRAYDTEGFADVYMNSIIGAVYSFYEFPKIKEVLDSFERKLVEDVITARIPSALGRDKLFDE